MGRKPSVLFVCTHNSARSQMAEGLLRSVAGDRFEVESAGTERTRVNPLAIRAMAEVGIDISGHTSKTVESLGDRTFDYVVTVCDSAAQACPVFPGTTEMLHWSLEDPSRATGTEAERLAVFRRIRDEIRARVTRFAADKGTPVSGGAPRVFDGGDMGCGELVMALAREMRALAEGDLLEVRTTDPGAPADLPAWARMAGHRLEAVLPAVGPTLRFLIHKGSAR